MHSDGKKCELQSYILDVKMAIVSSLQAGRLGS